jgi:hypothetical protein
MAEANHATNGSHRSGGMDDFDSTRKVWTKHEQPALELKGKKSISAPETSRSAQPESHPESSATLQQKDAKKTTSEGEEMDDEEEAEYNCKLSKTFRDLQAYSMTWMANKRNSQLVKCHRLKGNHRNAASAPNLRHRFFNLNCKQHYL